MLFKKEEKSTTEIVNEIQSDVYKYLKPLGFRKHGRTFCRFVDTDIAQVIEFQVGLALKGNNHCLWINIGIGIPECHKRTFDKEIPIKKYYHDYECSMQARLGSIVDKKDTYYDLRKKYDKYAKDITNRLEKYVIPVFDMLNNRESILKERRNYIQFDSNSHIILLDEAMIYGRMGKTEKAIELFLEYYDKSKQEAYEHREYILKNGEQIKDSKWYVLPNGGMCALPDENSGHLEYLEKLAKELNISL